MSPQLQTHRPVVRTDQLVCEDVSGECVIYDAREKKAHHLNSTLTWIWRRCDGNTTMEALADSFERQFNITDGLPVLITGIEQLEARNLLDNPVNVNLLAAEQTAISRRTVVAGGSVLMPLVVSILAPTPAAAKSMEKDKKKKG
jgi:coenzyme PQQ synthesis protein D (PqqD)